MYDMSEQISEIVDRVNGYLKEENKRPIQVSHYGSINVGKHYRSTYIIVLAKQLKFKDKKEFSKYIRELKKNLIVHDQKISLRMRNRFRGTQQRSGEPVYSLNKYPYLFNRGMDYMIYFRPNVPIKSKKLNANNMFDWEKPITMELICNHAINKMFLMVMKDVMFNASYLFGVDFEITKNVARAKYFDWIAEQEIGEISWDDVGGMDDAKDMLQRITIWMDEHPEEFQEEQRDHALLVGTPGIGKTLLIKAMLNRLRGKANILPMSVVGQFTGLMTDDGPTEHITLILHFINSLHKYTGRWTYLFIDEIDSIGQENKQAKALLREMDNVANRKFSILATTNRPDRLDFALFRPGRFYPIIYIGLPTSKDREHIWNVANKRYDLGLTEKAIKELVKATEGFSGADIVDNISKWTYRDQKYARIFKKDFDLFNNLKEHIKSNKEETVAKNKLWEQRIKSFIKETEATVMYL